MTSQLVDVAVIGLGSAGEALATPSHCSSSVVEPSAARRPRSWPVCTDTDLTAVAEDSDGIQATLSTGAPLDAAALLVATGQAPNWSDLGLERIGLDEEPDVDEEYRVAGRDWLRAIGDLNGKSPWTHGANHEARRLARLLLDEPPGPLTQHMAHCVFTAPPVAAVGLTAAAAVEAGHEVVVGTARYSDVARYATDDLQDGVVVVGHGVSALSR